MNKGLEALEKLNHTICLNLNEKRLKFDLDKYEHCDCENLKEFVDCYCLIEKELKALEIIRNKGVNVGNFKDMLEDWKDITFEDYKNYHVENGYELQNDYDFETNPLTQEEYDLLKEVLI